MIITELKRIICFLFIAVIITASAFGQDSEQAETGVYFDLLFDDYLELEASVLELVETGEIDSGQLTAIDIMLNRTLQENRADIGSRLNMLRFVAETGIAAIETADNADSFIAALSKTEKKRKAAAKTSGIVKTAAGISIGTAAVSGAVFAASSLLSQNYYEKYTQTETADQAAFFLFWGQFLDNLSAGSALITIISSAAAGILAAVF